MAVLKKKKKNQTSGAYASTKKKKDSSTTPSYDVSKYKPNTSVASYQAWVNDLVNQYKPNTNTLPGALAQASGQNPNTYDNKYAQMAEPLLNQYLSREEFKYDMNADPLYQQYKNQYTNLGNMAMQDTMGQASALTGGFGNSYAQTVGHQAYNQYLGQLNDKIPELYQIALDRYDREGNNLLNKYNILADRDAQMYDRFNNDRSMLMNELGIASDLYNQALSTDYGMYRDKVADEQWKYGVDYQASRDKAADKLTNKEIKYQKSRDKVADEQWNKTFNENVRQFNVSQNNAMRKAALSANKKNKKDDKDDKDDKKLENKIKKIKGKMNAKKASKYIDSAIPADAKNGKVKKTATYELIRELQKKKKITADTAYKLVTKYGLTKYIG